MSQKETRIWELLAKKICGEASEQELFELDTLLSSENNIYSQHVLEVLEQYWKNLHVASTGMENKSAIFLRKVSLELNSDHPPFEYSGTATHRISFMKNNWWKIAAAIVILIGTALIFTVLKKPSLEIASSDKTRKEIKLPDGTKIWLNSGSYISYSKKYPQSGKREVTLDGEAFFEVKHDARHPFIIHTCYGIDIQDLGTAFNVKAYPKDSSMETTLLRGAVEIYGENTPNQKLLLKPSQKFVYHTNKAARNHEGNVDMLSENAAISSGILGDDKFAIMNVGQVLNKEGDSLASETAWVQNELAFVSEPFSQLADRMEKWYNVKITIQDTTIANYRFTGVFEGETITQALDELQLIRAFQYKADDKGDIVITN